jgi:trehalose 6-phosphate phosphatase
MMRYALGESGRRRLQDLARSRALYAFDFDGTLTKIVRDHRAASLSAAFRAQLRALSRHAPTTIVSGRSLRDLQARVDGSVSHLIGNHGVEAGHELAGVMDYARRACAGWRRQVDARSGGLLGSLGVEVEDKTYSLTFHYRAAPRPRAARAAVIDALSEMSPSPRIMLGKSSVNAIPPGTPNKGGALLKLMGRLGVQHALFVGDDVTDEDVFGLRDDRIMTVRIGAARNSDAQFFLKRQPEVRDLLNVLLAAHNGTSMPGRSKRGTAGRPESGAV